MQSNTPTTDWESQLADLLCELSSVQQELLEVLSEKRDRMAASDRQGMIDLEPREERLCDRLQACHDRRAELLEAAAHQGLPGDSLERLACTLPPGSRDKLAKQVKDNSARMRLLQHHSLTNWVLAQRTILHLAQLLEIIATGGRLQPTYERGKSAACGGALVDSEA